MEPLELTAECPICVKTSRSLSVGWVLDQDHAWLLVERWECSKCHVEESLYIEPEEMPYMPCTQSMTALEIVETEDCE